MKHTLTLPFLLAATIFVSCSTAKHVGASSISKTARGYAPSLPNQVMEIDAISGSKVGSLMIDGYNFLTDSLVHKTYWGSSFWVSPESVWDFSAPDFDAKPYTSRIENGKVMVSSPKSLKTGLTVSKVFWADPRKLVDYVRELIR